MKKPLQRTFKDLQGYLGEMAKLAKGLDEKQTDQLNEVIRSIIVLLVAFRQSSRLGDVESPFISTDFLQ